MKTFCCCLPSRFGVLLLSPITCAASTVCSVVALYGLERHYDDLAIAQRVFLGLLGATMAIVALSSVFGFFGALLKSYKAVSFYSSALLSLWLSVLASGIINFVFLYKEKEDFVDRCAAHGEEQQSFFNVHGYADQEKVCNKTFALGFGLMVAFWGTVALLCLYLISIVRRYCRQLTEERHNMHQPTYQV